MDKEPKCEKCKAKMIKGEPFMHHMEEGYYEVPADVYYCSNKGCDKENIVIRIGNEEEIYNKLIEKYKYLKDKLPQVQDATLGKPIKPSFITPEELFELKEVAQELKKKCGHFLSAGEEFEIEERLKII